MEMSFRAKVALGMMTKMSDRSPQALRSKDRRAGLCKLDIFQGEVEPRNFLVLFPTRYNGPLSYDHINNGL